MKRVLIISDTPFAPSTFGNLTRDIAYQLHVNGMSVAVLGFGYSGWPFSDPMIPYPLYPWIGPPQQPQNIDDIFDEFKPDTLLLLGAPILFGWLRDHPRRNEFRLVLHTAFKSLPLVTTMRDIYNLSDMIIVNSLYEENNIHAALIEKDICRIPPFINKNKLYSSHENKKESGDFFGVACVAYDIPRMDMPTLFKSWGEVATRYRDILFGVFADPIQLMSWNIPDIIDVYSLRDRVTVNTNPLMNFGFPSLGDLYSSIDLLVVPSQEEILNPVILEAAYCVVPMIVSGGGATEEFLPEGTIILKNSDTFIAPPMNTNYHVFDADEMTECICKRYNAKNRRRPPKAHDVLSVEDVADQWIQVL